MVADISDFSKEDDVVYLTAFLFARVSNIVPPSRKSVDLSHVLSLEIFALLCMVSRSLFIGLKLKADVPKASSFRGHSFHRSWASWAFNTGVPGELIQIFGVWSS